jgi:hypothetical protein
MYTDLTSGYKSFCLNLLVQIPEQEIQDLESYLLTLFEVAACWNKRLKIKNKKLGVNDQSLRKA